MIVGTSMGAVVGGLYSAGWSPSELETIISEMDWIAMFRDSIDHRDKAFPRKLDDVEYLVRGSIRFRDGRPYLPLGLLEGHRIEQVLKILEIRSTEADDFDDLPTRFRAVAADLGSSEAVLLDGPGLSKSIRASMSIPGMFAPVEIDGRQLVDGGVTANLAVGIASELGAENLIVVSVSTGLDPNANPESLFRVMLRLTYFLTAGNVERDLELIGENDVFIHPDVSDIGFLDFTRARDAVEIGRTAALAARDDLARFSVDDEKWAEYLVRRQRTAPRAPVIDSIDLKNHSSLNDGIIRAAIEVEPGEALDLESLADRLMALHGLDMFGRIEFDVVEGGGSRDLKVEVNPPPHGVHNVRFGLGLYDDFDSVSDYNIAIQHRMLPLNRFGAEWNNLIQLGSKQILRTEIRQPLDSRLHWFLAPSAEAVRDRLPLSREGEVIEVLNTESLGGRLDFGRTLSNIAEIRLGPYWFDRKINTRIGVPGLVDFEGIDAGARMRFDLRTYDQVVFPGSGGRIGIEIRKSLEDLGAELDFETISASGSLALSFGSVVVVPAFELFDSSGENDNIFATQTLGGFWRLSGYEPDEFIGTRSALVRTIVYRELVSASLLGLESRLYGGISAELGNARLDDESMTIDDMLASAAVFLGADTAIGPVYLAYGIGEHGRDAIYLTVGRTF